MIPAVIRWSIANRFLVLMATRRSSRRGGVVACCVRRWMRLPDLSDVQVIIRTHVSRQAPRIVEDQVTYPLTTTMLSVPGAKTVRGYSFFGDSFVYVLFEDGTDLYWARSRVLEYLNQVQSRLPPRRKTALGPGCHRRRLDLRVRAGRSHRHSMIWRSCARCRTGSSSTSSRPCPTSPRCATVGGMVRQYQIVLDPGPACAPTASRTPSVIDAVRSANQETGGSVLELGEAEYMVRARGYLQNARRLPRNPV